MKFLRSKNYLILTASAIAFLLWGIFLFFGDSPAHYTISYLRTPELGEVVVISFSSPISEEAAMQTFQIEPEVQGELHWFAEYKELYFVPNEGFNPSETYAVRIQNTSSLFAALQTLPKFTFQPEGLPTKLHVRVPQNPTIYYITESGLKRPFPNMEVFHSYSGNREEDVKIIDKQTLALYPDNTLIHLHNNPNIYKLENGRKYLIQNAHTFNALGLNWNGIAPINLVQFDDYPTGKPINIESLPRQATSKGKFIEIDLEKMKIKLWEDGRLAKTFEVAGKGNPQSAPTRKGLFSVLSKEPNHFSSLSRVWMPWSMQYSGDYFIHEWPYWPGGKLITAKYSAGCVRLNVSDAKKMYDWTEVGTPILVH